MVRRAGTSLEISYRLGRDPCSISKLALRHHEECAGGPAYSRSHIKYLMFDFFIDLQLASG